MVLIVRLDLRTSVIFQKKQKNQVNESQIKREIKEDFFLNHEGSYKTFYQSSMVV
ncbi:conserved protein of unknown function [Streptococcus thermophilus]|nr:conserved protein of unknown function [Streptococcus thermophilus]CAD0154439.1 conserved protein of unknown function [Streptococcus thermophilus]CAD0168093.1 conserved protein of unknown function [Streptococcus thermophilus]CAD0170224.1 conserved protein of unknown function [Streptococcus thermophilus]CAD0180618.1 conserved protein of unknown function [Streptococcus thermophilus]